jgi:hypothetical protein
MEAAVVSPGLDQGTGDTPPTETEVELSDSPAIAARNIQQADSAAITAQVQPTTAVVIPLLPCREPDIPSALLTSETLAGHNTFVKSQWEEFYGVRCELDSHADPFVCGNNFLFESDYSRTVNVEPSCFIIE